MEIRPDEITSILKKQIEQFESETALEEEGQVLQVGDGIARVYGLDNVMSMELMEFPNDVYVVL